MTMANVHEAMITIDLIRKCRLSGQPDSVEHCATWHRNLNSLKTEFFQSLDAIGWHEFSDASNRIRELNYPPDHKGTSGLMRDLLTICDHLELIVESYSRNPDSWMPIGKIKLLSATAGSTDDTTSKAQEQRLNYQALPNENKMLRPLFPRTQLVYIFQRYVMS